ncbi:MAG: glycosyltransferase family 2 protein [Actinomycetota bacterium]
MTRLVDGTPTSLTVMIPALNAAGVIDRCLDAILAQDVEIDFDVVVAVGRSADGTADRVDARAADDGRVRRIDNPSGDTPRALNLAIQSSSGDLVVRVDAQAELPAGYLARILHTAIETGAANVGGIQRAVGEEPWARAIAAAMRSRFGVGPAQFRSGSHEGPTDTVYLGGFRRHALDVVGGYDESLIRNQDYELNYRLRKAGFVVWLDPSLVVDYTPRGSLRSLWSQYRQYGRWKRVVISRSPRSVRPRQIAAPALVLGLIGSAVLLAVGSPVGLALPVVYATAVAVFAARPRGASRRRVALAFATMHVAWGWGFLFSWR